MLRSYRLCIDRRLLTRGACLSGFDIENLSREEPGGKPQIQTPNSKHQTQTLTSDV
jgi:hypothetical protein